MASPSAISLGARRPSASKDRMIRPTPLRPTGSNASSRSGLLEQPAKSFAADGRRLSNTQPLRSGELRPLSPSSRKSPPVLAHAPTYRPEELASFSELCKTAYYDDGQLAAKLVEQTVRNQPQSSRAAFIRAQSAVRVQYHRDMELRRRAELERTIADTEPGGVVRRLVGGSNTAMMRSGRARHERQTRLARFLNSHALR